MSQQVPEPRFKFGRMVKSAAPPADVVQQILEQRNLVRDGAVRDGAVRDGAVRDTKTEDAPDVAASNSDNGSEIETLRRALEPQTQQIDQIADGLGQLFDLVIALHDQDAAENKAFDTLHAELSDYKNDFFYERLKPFARQLLFVCDALEQYQSEVALNAAQGQILSAGEVQENVAHCAAQLRDALLLIETEPISDAQGAFDPKTQRAVEVESVPGAQDKQVVRQVRAGWTMGGNLLRPADVVVGKSGSDTS